MAAPPEEEKETHEERVASWQRSPGTQTQKDLEAAAELLERWRAAEPSPSAPPTPLKPLTTQDIDQHEDSFDCPGQRAPVQDKKAQLGSAALHLLEPFSSQDECLQEPHTPPRKKQRGLRPELHVSTPPQLKQLTVSAQKRWHRDRLQRLEDPIVSASSSISPSKAPSEDPTVPASSSLSLFLPPRSMHTWADRRPVGQVCTLQTFPPEIREHYEWIFTMPRSSRAFKEQATKLRQMDPAKETALRQFLATGPTDEQLLEKFNDLLRRYKTP